MCSNECASNLQDLKIGPSMPLPTQACELCRMLCLEKITAMFMDALQPKERAEWAAFTFQSAVFHTAYCALSGATFAASQAARWGQAVIARIQHLFSTQLFTRGNLPAALKVCSEPLSPIMPCSSSSLFSVRIAQS